MQFVDLEPRADGYWYDASRYREALPGFAEQLPPGALAWASDPAHYDFGSTRCVKDLSLVRIDWQPTLVLHLGPNPWKHEHGLEIRYQGVMTFNVEVTQAANAPPPSVQLDEVLPIEQGCQHEVAFHGGRITVIAADMEARWHEDR